MSDEKVEKKHEVVMIGAGPSALAAAVYTTREDIDTVLIEKGVSGGGLWGASIRAILVFIQIYIFRLGFLDGSVGFLMAVIYSQGAFNKYAALWSLRQK